MLANVQQQVNSHLLEWNYIIDAFRVAVRKQAHSEAEYKHARARFIVRFKAENTGVSHAAAESAADADDALHSLRLARLGDDAEVEAFKAKLAWCRERSQHLRSEKVDERQSNQLYAENPAGA